MTDESFSQFGEDLVIGALLPDEFGWYVDVGAYHPTRYSNTYLLHRRGWRGINIDLHPVTAARFEAARPNDVNICSAVGASCGTVEAFLFGESASPIHSTDRDTADLWRARFHADFTAETVESHTLDCILERHAPAEGVDLVSIDVEGAEEAVLSGFTVERWLPRVIAIEIHPRPGAPISESPVALAMDAVGYDLHAHLRVTAVFVRRPHASRSQRVKNLRLADPSR